MYFPKKSVWKGKAGHAWEFFCPFCKLKRKIPYRAQPGGFKQIFQVAVTAAFVMLVSWPWFDWKGIITFVPLWMTFEVYYRSKLRTVLLCDNCGFDPYLYLTDVKKARSELEKHLRAKYAEKGIPFPEKESAKAPKEKVDAPVKPQGDKNVQL